MKIILPVLVSVAFVAAALGEPVPLSSRAPVAVEKLRVDNPAILPMTGGWKFQIAKGRERTGTFVPEFICVTASSEQTEHKAGDAFGSSNSFWSAGRGTFPQWWQVDLGELTAVQALQLLFEDKSFVYEGRAETSKDGTNWTSLANLNANPPANNGEIAVTPTKCRYLRVTFTGGRNESGEVKWAFIRHIRITVLRNGKEVAWNPETDAKEAALAHFEQVGFKDQGFASQNQPLH